MNAALLLRALNESSGWAAEPHWATEMASLAAPPWWSEDLAVGACPSAPPVLTGRWGDCDAGEAGSFRLHAPMRETTRAAGSATEREFRSAAIACHWLCTQCARCNYVSFARRSPQECVWRQSCEGFPRSLDGNVRYRSARVRDAAAGPAGPAGSAGPAGLAGGVPAAAAPAAAGAVARAPTDEGGGAPTAQLELGLRSRRLIFVTASYPHEAQESKLARCAAAIGGALRATRHVLWILAEDASTPTPAAARLLAALSAREPRVRTHHLAVGPTRSKGHAQRRAALRWLRAQRGLGGVVYNLDDDNEYHPALWAALLELRPGRVGALAVGFPTPPNHAPLRGEVVIEGPVYAPGGRLKGFAAGWCHDDLYKYQYGARFFCIDMGGFAFDAALLRKVRGVPWSYMGRRARGRNATEWRGGESEFVEQLLPSGFPEDLQPLANCGHDVLVMHNALDFAPEHLRAHRMAPHAQRFACREHGW